MTCSSMLDTTANGCRWYAKLAQNDSSKQGLIHPLFIIYDICSNDLGDKDETNIRFSAASVQANVWETIVSVA